MDLKNSIVTGKHIREFEAELNVGSLRLQSLLGLYAPTVTKLTSSVMIDQPIDRLYAGLIRFYSNNPEVLDSYPGRVFFGNSTLQNLKDACQRAPLSIGGQKIDATTNAHIGILIFRGYGAARKFMNEDSQLTLPIILWINIICHCLSLYRQDLIEQVIMDEVYVHKISVDALLKKSWPSIV